MKFAHHIYANKLQFTAFSSEDVRKLSVARIVTPISFDILGNALPGGLYDPAMGNKMILILFIYFCNMYKCMGQTFKQIVLLLFRSV